MNIPVMIQFAMPATRESKLVNLKTSTWLPTHVHSQPQSRWTFPYTAQPALSQKGAWLEGVDIHRWQLPDSSRKTSDRHIRPSYLFCQLGWTKWYGRYKHHWHSWTGCYQSRNSSRPLTFCHWQPLISSPNQEALAVHWASPPPRARGSSDV